MDEFQCSWCSRRFYRKDGHFCFLKGKPDNEYSESDIDELERLAEKLEAATINQDCTSDDFGHLSKKTQAHDIQLNSSLDSGSNFLTKNIFRGERVTSSPVSPFITQCHGSNLDVPRPDSHVSAQQSTFVAIEESLENSFFLPVQTLQGDFCLADDSNSNPSENLSSPNDSGWCNLRPVEQMKLKNTSFGVNTNNFRKKENKSSAFNRRRKRAYLDSISASPMCVERDGNNAEAQKGKDYSKTESTSAKVTEIDDRSSSEIATNSEALGSVSDAEAVSVPGPSGIHSQSHRICKEKRFLCDVCRKVFGKKHHLKLHQRTHTSEKPFECLTCDKRFTQQGNLTRHLRTHTGEKPFVCDICRKGFTRKEDFDIHYRTHTGEKPYACNICGKRFSARKILKRHVPTHEEGKRYKCGVCGKTFSRNDSRNRHHKEKHQ